MIKAKHSLSLFIDSGAHGLYNEHVFKKKHSSTDKYEWYSTKEFWQYVDEFAAFIKQYPRKINLFANVDVIFNPELTWKVQQYFEDVHQITPLPVIHYGTPMKWLAKYLEKDYKYIGLGGIGQEISKSKYIGWADKAFNLICDQPSRLPLVKVHGFAMTAHYLMVRYPWYSIDSTSWLAFGGYGFVIYPAWKNGGWDYSVPYNVVRVSVRSSKSNKVNFLNSLKEEEKQIFLRYIEEKGFVLGKSVMEDGEEKIIEPGLVNDDVLRCDLNALYFIDLVNYLPKWPWAFEMKDFQSKLSLL